MMRLSLVLQRAASLPFTITDKFFLQVDRGNYFFVANVGRTQMVDARALIIWGAHIKLRYFFVTKETTESTLVLLVRENNSDVI